MPMFPGVPLDNATPPAPRFPGVPIEPRAAPAPEGVSTDVPKSLLSGVVRGAAETAMLPITIDRAGKAAGAWVVDKADAGVRNLLGMAPRTEPVQPVRTGISDTLNGAQDFVRGAMDNHLHAPTTTPGDYAETIGEFAPGAVMGGGGVARKVIGDWLLPAVASEAAGQATKGTAFETPARFVGGFAGNLPAVAARLSSTAADRALAAATGGVAPSQFDAAARLQEAGARLGVPLTGPEAVQAVTGNGTRLGDLQRVVEGSNGGGQTLASFYADRPDRVAGAAGRAFDMIAPVSPQPSLLGPRAADAATAAIRDVERQRTAAVSPYFAAAGRDAVPVERVNSILDDINAEIAADKTGVLAGPLGELRSRLIAEPGRPGAPTTRSPVVGPDGRVVRYSATPATEPTSAVPVTDLENLNRARKYFRDKLDLPQIGQDATTKEQSAAISRYLDRLDGLMTEASPSYQAGNAEYSRLSDTLVNPIANGPLGAFAKASDTDAAVDAILPRQPLTGGTDELLDAIMRTERQAPGVPAQLVRQGLADRFDRSTGRLVGGENQYGGAKFAKDIAGTSQQEADLKAVLDAIAAPASNGTSDLLDVFRATGARKPQGSATAFNQRIQDELGQLPGSVTALAGAKTAGLALAREIGDAARRASLGKNTGALADVFIAPDSVRQLQALAARGAGRNEIGEAIARAMAQATAGGK